METLTKMTLKLMTKDRKEHRSAYIYNYNSK